MNATGGDRVLGELYEAALAGAVQAEVEHADGTRMPLAVDQWLHEHARATRHWSTAATGPTLDVGSGPGRLTVALAERGVPALGIDVTPYAVKIAQSSGALAILRDVFGRVPGAGRWMTVLLADGNIGIGGDPAALLRRVGELLAPGGHAFVEVQPPGRPLRVKTSGCARTARPVPGSRGPTWGPIRSATSRAAPGWSWRRPGPRAGAGSPRSPAEPAAVAGPHSRCYRMFARDRRRGSSAWIRRRVLRHVMTAKLRVGAVIAALVMICGLEFPRRPADRRPAACRCSRCRSSSWPGVAVRRRGVAAARRLAALGGGPHHHRRDRHPGRGDVGATAVERRLYRYMWDGRVQARGIDPYAYVPVGAAAGAPARPVPVDRRPDALRRPALRLAGRVSRPPGGRRWSPGCTRINRPTVPTIYPPVAEAYFLALHYVTPVRAGSTPVQAAAGACAVLVTLVLLAGLRWLRRDLRWAALWAWCPTVALEAGNNAHVDVVAVLLTAVALLVLARRATTPPGALLGGALLGLAIATKMTPGAGRARACCGAAGGRSSSPRPARSPSSTCRTCWRSAARSSGSCRATCSRRGTTAGSGSRIIALFAEREAGHRHRRRVLAVTGLAVLRFSDPDRPWRGAVVMTGVALAVTTPDYQWYAILLVMLVVLDGRPEWLAFAAGGYLAAFPTLGGRYHIPGRLHDAIAYGVPLLVVGAGWLIRHELARRRASSRGASHGGAGGGGAGARGGDARGGWGGHARTGGPRSPGLTRLCFLTGWLPPAQTSNGTGPQDRE